VVGTRSGQLTNDQGGLVGPFNAFVHAPGVGQHLCALGAKVRYDTSIDRRLSELAIITVGARWKAEFEWWAHARMARRNGVPDAVVDAIERGEEPNFEVDDERVIYAFASQLVHAGQVTQDAYDAARQLLGDPGLVELVSLCGYYTLVSFLLNAFAVPLPDGVAPVFTPPPS
jgi:4-carboxymuconolactone decarboxylase